MLPRKYYLFAPENVTNHPYQQNAEVLFLWPEQYPVSQGKVMHAVVKMSDHSSPYILMFASPKFNISPTKRSLVKDYYNNIDALNILEQIKVSKCVLKSSTLLSVINCLSSCA